MFDKLLIWGDIHSLVKQNKLLKKAGKNIVFSNNPFLKYHELAQTINPFTTCDLPGRS